MNTYNLLNTYNVLDHHSNPEHRLPDSKKLFDPINPIPIPINRNTESVSFSGSYSMVASEDVLANDLAISTGIKGNYKFYSGAAEVHYTTDYKQSTYSLNAKYSAELNYGNALYMGTNDEILDYWESKVKTDLYAIQSHNDAKKFVNKYGTHIITQVGLGGQVFLAIQADSKTKESKETLEASLSGAYNNGVSSIETMLSVKTTQKNQHKHESLSQKMITMGGNPSLVGVQNSDQKVRDWQASVNGDTAYKIMDSIAFWDLPGVTPSIHNYLQEYVHYSLLFKSINKPTIFSKIDYFTESYQKTILDVAPGYKIISGGAEVKVNSHEFLISSYPETGSGTMPLQWVAEAHDNMEPWKQGDTLTAYAVGVLDPFDLLDVVVKKSEVVCSHQSGQMSAEAHPDPSTIVTGGGMKGTQSSNGYYKWMYTNIVDGNGWSAGAIDYMVGAPEATLQAFVIGIKLKTVVGDSKLTPYYTEISETEKSHIEINCPVAYNTHVAGGGFGISHFYSDGGNLCQQVFPRDDKTFHAYSCDTNGLVAKASGVGRAISVVASSYFFDPATDNIDAQTKEEAQASKAATVEA